jgi:hypothetical protein
MVSPVEPLVRAAAALELIDGMLLVPAPLCADFFHPAPKHVPCRLALAPCPDEQQSPQLDRAGASDPQHSVVEGAPAVSFTVVCSGQVFLESILSKQRPAIRRPCRELLIRYEISYVGPLSLDDDDGGGGAGGGREDNPEDAEVTEEAPAETVSSSRTASSRDGPAAAKPPPSALSPQPGAPAAPASGCPNGVSSSSPIAVPLYRDGTFYAPILLPPLADEGRYELRAAPALRDRDGQEWRVSLLPADGGGEEGGGGGPESALGTIPVRISRGRGS